MNETARPVTVPQLNLMKAVQQQEKQVLAREIIERDKLAKGLATLQQKRSGNAKQDDQRNKMQMLKTVGDENIGEIGLNNVKNQAKAGGAPRNTFTNFRQSEAGQANRVTEDNEGQEPSQ